MEMGHLNQIMTWTAKLIEICGVIVIIVGGLVSSYQYVQALSRQANDAYEQYRGSLGRAILLGLEFLVAGDIIGTVAGSAKKNNHDSSLMYRPERSNQKA